MKEAGTVLLLAFITASSGCTQPPREGELVNHSIDCEKSGDVWVLARKDVFNRFNVVQETHYQVSFTAQLVVIKGASAFPKCTVYDVRNWYCEDRDGSVVEMTDTMETPWCSKMFNSCSLKVNSFNRLMIMIKGVEEADRLCRVNSRFLTGISILNQRTHQAK